MRPVSRNRTQVLVTTTKRQTGICHTLSLWLGHVVLCLSWTVGVVATRALGSMTSLWTGVLWMKKRVFAVHGKGCEFKSLGDEGDRGFPVPLVEFLGALRGLPVKIDADTGAVEVEMRKSWFRMLPNRARHLKGLVWDLCRRSLSPLKVLWLCRMKTLFLCRLPKSV